MPYKDPEVAKAASRKRQRKYYETHKEKCRAAVKKWQQEHPEQVKESSRKAYLRRREQPNTETAEERSLRLEKQREATKKYRERNAEELKEKAERLKGTEEQKAIWREKTRKWRADNPEAAKAIAQRSDHVRYYALKAEAYRLLGNKCSKCDWTDWAALQIDHPDAIGDARRRELGEYGRKLYQEVIKNPDPKKYQLLCANHNWTKRVEFGEHLKKSDSRSITSALVND